MSRRMTALTGLKRAAMFAAVVGLLVGCGAPTAAPKAAAPTAAPEATKAPEPTAVPEATQAPEAGGMKKYTGEIVVGLTLLADNPAMLGLIEAYNKVQPGVKIVVESPPPGGDYTQWLGTQLAAGNVRPDIVAGNYQKTYGKYVNLDKYRFQTNPYTGKTWDEDLDWNFYAERNTKGERIMLASESVHILWFFNQDLFTKAGVEPPKTWDDFVAVCDKLLAAGITPIGTNYIWKLNQWLPEIYFDQYYRNIIDIIRAQPGDYNYDEELDGKNTFNVKDPYPERKFNMNSSRYYGGVRDGKIKWDSPETAEVARQFARVFPKCASPSLFVDATENSQFLQGQVAIQVDGTWALPGLTRDMAKMTAMSIEEQSKLVGITLTNKLQPFKWATFENPGMTGPLVKADVRSIESAAGVYLSAVDKSAAQTEMVMDFLMFWLSKPGYQAWVDGGVNSPEGYNPAGQIMVRGVALPADLQALVDSIKMLGNVEMPPWPFIPFRHWNIENVDKKGQEMFKNALEGKITPEEFATQVQKLWMDNMDEIIAKAGLTKDDLDNPDRDPAK